MQWLELTVKTASEGISLLASELTAMGYDSFIIDDQREFQNFLAENTAYWDYVDDSLTKKMEGLSQIRLYLESTEHAPAQLQALQQSLAALKKRCPDAGLGPLTISVAPVPEEDWENSWKKNYPPVPVGRRLLVVPCWLSPENPEHRIPVRLEPGMIFGTGAHETTQLCMCALEQTVHGGERVADLGSGSGILSITALLLGAASATGIDIDPMAADIARENAAMNGIEPSRFSAETGNILTDRDALQRLSGGGYDIVCANIVADVILAMAPVVPQFLRPDAVFICSGILLPRAGEVEEALRAADLQVRSRVSAGEWCCFVAARAEK